MACKECWPCSAEEILASLAFLCMSVKLDPGRSRSVRLRYSDSKCSAKSGVLLGSNNCSFSELTEVAVVHFSVISLSAVVYILLNQCLLEHLHSSFHVGLLFNR